MKLYYQISPSETELQSALEFWQNKLRLRDWDISAKVVPISEFPDNLWHGDCCHLHGAMTAKIRIARPESDFPSNQLLEPDWEDTLVHELLHVIFSTIVADQGTPEVESVITRLAGAFVSLYREAKTQEEE